MEAPLAMALALLASMSSAATRQGSPDRVREAFEDAAARLDVVDYGDVVYGRVGTRGTALPTQDGPADQVLSRLLGRNDPLDDVLALLAHPDPRVRTLALVELFDREDPRLLPHLVGRAHDEGLAIPQVARFASAVVFEGGRSRRIPEDAPAPEPRTVGQVARELIGFYMEPSGFSWGVDGYRNHPGWDVYWAERAERSSCATWLLVRLLRAYGGVSPLTSAARPRLRQVRSLVDALPGGERELVLLWLPDVEGAFSTEAERLAAAAALGREQLLAILRREPPTDDPDLLGRTDANAGRYPCEDVARFVLEHAGELLAPRDVPVLLELEAGERERASTGDAWPMRTPLWRVAAAQLDPRRAHEHLETAWAVYGGGDGPRRALDRMAILRTAWSLLDERVDAWVAERFWAETQGQGYWPYGLTSFVDRLVQDDPVQARRQLAVLLRHPGFERCDWVLLAHLARRIDAWSEPAVIGEQELGRARHPCASSNLVTADQLARAAEQYPDQTRALLDRLAGWRERLVESIPRWERDDR